MKIKEKRAHSATKKTLKMISNHPNQPIIVQTAQLPKTPIFNKNAKLLTSIISLILLLIPPSFSATGEYSSCPTTITNCISCIEGSSANQACTTCKPGFNIASSAQPTLVATTQIGCQVNTDPKCLYAGQAGNNGKCTLCKDGYGLKKDGICYLCSPGCQRCVFTQTSGSSSFLENVEVCVQCYSNYTTAGDYKCEKCNEFCSKCTSKDICVECQKGYYLEKGVGKCRPCMPGCESCVNGTSCSSCDGVNFYFRNASCFGIDQLPFSGFLGRVGVVFVWVGLGFLVFVGDG